MACSRRRGGGTFAEQVKDFAIKIAISAESFARAVSVAITQPADVDINEILFRPRAQAE